VSRLKINFSKSGFGVVGVSERWKDDAAMFLKCSLLAIPFLYLGIPIGTNPRRTEVWDPIIKKCKRKLSKQKQNLLSFGGRVTLKISFKFHSYLSLFFFKGT